MKKIKVYCKNNSSYQANFQRGNTLVPVIIGLAISAIATIAFLNQGANLSQKNKVTIAQNELAAVMQEWHILKESIGINNITGTNFPSAKYRTNIYGHNTSYYPNFRITTRRKVLTYDGPSDISNCNKIGSVFANAKGVSQNPVTYMPGQPYQAGKCYPSENGFTIILPLE
jgi:hypothetical protein